MKITVRELSKKLSLLKEELQDKEVVIRSRNADSLMEPEIKFILKDEMNPLDKSKDNVERIFLDC